jgi:hypothetical protein
MSVASRALPLLALLALLAGCAEMQTIRLSQDRPEMLDELIEQHEFVRARQLTGRYPEIDTPETQQRIKLLEQQYAADVLGQAGIRAADDDLLGAVQLLTEGLEQVPHDEGMRSLRAELEARRAHQLRINERGKLVARGDYLIDQQKLYREQVNLKTPGFLQRREIERIEGESQDIARQLLEHAGYARETGDDAAARTCLVLSLELHETIEAHDLLVEMLAIEQSNIRTAQQAIENRRAEQARKQAEREQQVTEQLLEATRQALDANQLQDARMALASIPSSTSNDSEVLAAQNSVGQVIDVRVRELLVKGDAEYRAEKILDALKTWTEALSLDPDNQKVRERIERANKVLARLESLRRQQK